MAFISPILHSGVQFCTHGSNSTFRCTVYNSAFRCTIVHSRVQFCIHVYCVQFCIQVYNSAFMCTILHSGVQFCIQVYTVSQESKHLQVHGVPTLRTEQQLLKLFQKYGAIKQWRKLEAYPCEDFTETYLFTFENIHSAR